MNPTKTISTSLCLAVQSLKRLTAFAATTAALAAIALIMGITACSVDDAFTTDSNIGYLTLNNISVGGAVSKTETHTTHTAGTLYSMLKEGDIIKISYDFTGIDASTNTAYAKLSGSTTWTIYTDVTCTTEVKLRPDGKTTAAESWENLTLALYFHPLQVVDQAYSTDERTTDAYYDISSAATKGDVATAGNYSVGKTDADRGQISANLAHTNALLTLLTSSIAVNDYAEGYNNISDIKAVVTHNVIEATLPFIKGTDSYQCIVPAGATLKRFTLTLTDGKETPATTNLTVEMTANAFIANSNYPLSLSLRPNSIAVTIDGALAGWGEEEKNIPSDEIKRRDYTLTQTK